MASYQQVSSACFQFPFRPDNDARENTSIAGEFSTEVAQKFETIATEFAATETKVPILGWTVLQAGSKFTQTVTGMLAIVSIGLGIKTCIDSANLDSFATHKVAVQLRQGARDLADQFKLTSKYLAIFARESDPITGSPGPASITFPTLLSSAGFSSLYSPSGYFQLTMQVDSAA